MSEQLHGIDVSRWQGVINWDLVKAQTNFAIIKSSGGDGGLYADSQFARNKAEARRVGILHGFYHYAGGVNSPEAEADQFVNTVGDLQKGEMLVLDWEESNPDVVGWCLRFCKRVEERTGVKPLIYTNGARVTGYDWQALVSNNNGLWVASWGPNSGQVPSTQPSIGKWPFWAIWQYSSKGNIAGMSPLDLDLFAGDGNAFLAYGNGSGAPAQPSTPPPTQQTPTANVGQYVVTSRDYDGLAAAMQRIGISDWKSIADRNGLSAPYVIRVGQVLTLTGQTAVAPSNGTYTVKSTDADGLAAAMARIGVSNWQAVAQHNGLTAPYIIKVGQVLNLPGGTPSTNTSRSSYVVQARDADGLAAAMSRIGISNWRAVAALNGLTDPFIIKVGQKLWLN